jgi:hypothetical protein
MTLFDDFLLFLKNPEYEPIPDKTVLKKFISRILNGFLLYFIVSLIAGIVMNLLKYWDLVPVKSDKLLNAPLSIYILILVPVIEELIFRLPMRFSRINISISFLAFVFALARVILKMSIPVSSLIAIFPGVALFLLLAEKRHLHSLQEFWVNHFKWIFYTLTLTFGFLHITNFIELKPIHFLLMPFITIYQILLGFILGYFRVRFKNGIVYSILLHILTNLPGLLVLHSSSL